MSLLMNQFTETNPNLLEQNTLPGAIPLHMTILTIKIQIRGTVLTIDLLLQTSTTMNAILVILEIVRDQRLLIGILQIVDLPSHTKETNHQPEIKLLRSSNNVSKLPLQTKP